MSIAEFFDTEPLWYVPKREIRIRSRERKRTGGSSSTQNVDISSAEIPSTQDTSQQCSWLMPVVENLIEMSELQANWNGPGSKIIEPDVIENVLTLVATIMQPNTRAPTIAPFSDGSLQLVWYAAGLELEIIVDKTGFVGATLFDIASGEERELALEDQELAEAIARLSKP